MDIRDDHIIPFINDWWGILAICVLYCDADKLEANNIKPEKNLEEYLYYFVFNTEPADG